MARSRARLFATIGGALFLVVALLVAAAAWWALRSESGAAAVLTRIPGLSVEGQQGPLVGGPFAARRLVFEAAGTRVVVDDVRWDDLQWRWRPTPGQWVGVHVRQPKAARVEVTTTPSNQARTAPTNLRLPFALRLEDASLDTLVIVAPPTTLTDLRGTIHLGEATAGGQRHRIDHARATWRGVRLGAAGTVDADAPMAVAMDVDARPADDAQARLPWQGTARVSGPLATLDAQAQLRAGPMRDARAPAPASPSGASAPARPELAVDARTTIAPFAPWPLGALDATLRDLDLAAFAPDAPVTRIAGRVVLTMPSRDAPLSLRATLDNAEPGRLDQHRAPITHAVVAATGRAKDGTLDAGQPVTIDAIDITLHDDAGRVEGRGTWEGDALDITLDTKGLRPSRLDASFATMTLGGPLTATVRGVPSLDDIVAGRGAVLGTLDARVQSRLRGQLDGGKLPAAAVTFDAHAKREVDAHGKERSLVVALDAFSAEAAGATTQLTGRASRKAGGPWSLQAKGNFDNVDPLPWYPGTPGSAWREGTHRFAGRIDAAIDLPANQAGPDADFLALAQRARGKLDIALADARLAGVPLNGTLAWRNETGDAQLRAALDAAGNTVDVDATLAATATQDRAKARVRAPRLAALSPIARLHPALARALPQAGTLQGDAALDGRWPQAATSGKLESRGLRVGAWQLDTGSITWRAGTDANAPLRVDLDLAGLAQALVPNAATPGGTQRRLENAKLVVDGSLAAHRIDLQALSPIRPPAWSDTLAQPQNVPAPTDRTKAPAADDRASAPTPRADSAATRGTTFTLRADGRYAPNATGTSSSALTDGGTWSLRVAQAQARARRGQPVWVDAADLAADIDLAPGAVPVRAQLAPGRVTLLGAPLAWTQARWARGAGSARDGVDADAIDIRATLEPLRVAPLVDRLLPDIGVGGDLRIGGELIVQTTPERFSIEGVLERRDGDLTVIDDGVAQTLGLDVLRVAVNAQEGTWHFTQAASGTNLGVLGGAQTVRIDARSRWPSATAPLEGVMSWRVDNLATLAPWLPPGWRATGTLQAGASFGGRFGDPEISGSVDGSKLGVRNLLEGVDWHDGDLRVALRGQQATIDRFTFRGGAGELQLGGGASIGASPSVNLTLRARQFQVLGRVDRRLIASGDARATIRADELQLDGRFVVDEGLFDLRRRDAPRLDGDVSVVRADDDAAAAGADDAADRDAASADAAPRRGPLAKSTIAVQLDLGPQLRLVGRGIDTRLAGALAITSPNNRLAVNGTVQAEDGTYKAYGQNLVIRRGVVRFTGPAESPQLDIVAGRDNLDIEVGVAITGSAQNPRVRLVSEPEMSDVDKLSWLMLGRGPDGLGRADTALLQRAALAIWAGEEGSSPSDSLLQTLGIDELSVRQTETGDVRDTVIRVGKQISRRWYVGYERGVNAGTGTWQVIYRVAQRLLVRAQGGDDDSLDMIWSWRWN